MPWRVVVARSSSESSVDELPVSAGASRARADEEQPAEWSADDVPPPLLIDHADYFALAPDLFTITSSSTALTHVNPAWTRILGWTDEHLANRFFADFVHDDDRPTLHLSYVNLERDGRIDGVELRMRCRDGRYRTIVWSAVEERSADRVYAVGRDVTESREERARLDRLKDEFLSTVSHELRTPLTSIRGALGLLDSGVVEDQPEKRRELVRIASANCDRLVALVNDMLDMQNIESGLIHFDSLLADVNEIVRRTVALNKSFADLCDVRFELSASRLPLIAVVDTGRIEQVLSNLLSNAAKFSPAGSHVEIRVEGVDGRVRVSVRDFGDGIPDEFQARVFQRFAQAESTDARRFGGSGLGLHISRLIVERHRGNIGFESTVGEGTMFWFDLPLAPARRARLSTEDVLRFTPMATRAVSALPRVLHVEDDVDLGRIVRECLGPDFDVVTVTTARAARHHFRDEAVDLMILDIGLPDSDGLRLIPRLRVAQPNTPVVVFSGDTCPPGGVAGVEVWLEKTRTTEVELAAIVRTLLKA